MNKAEKDKILQLCQQLPQASVWGIINMLTAMVQAIKDTNESTVQQ